MQYLLLLYADANQFLKMTPAEQKQGMAAYQAFTEALTKAGALKGSNRLQPTSAATTVRIKDDKSQVLNGPYAESKEQLGGYYLIEAKDLNDAIQVASRIPSARSGSIEVWPIVERTQA